MNTRRSFLGQLLGTIVASKLPFVGELNPIKQYDEFDRIKELNKLWNLPIEELMKIQGFYSLGEKKIKATKIIDVIKTDSHISWRLEDWEALDYITISKMGICYPDGFQLAEGSLNQSANLMPLDILKGTYAINRQKPLFNSITIQSNKQVEYYHYSDS